MISKLLDGSRDVTNSPNVAMRIRYLVPGTYPILPTWQPVYDPWPNPRFKYGIDKSREETLNIIMRTRPPSSWSNIILKMLAPGIVDGDDGVGCRLGVKAPTGRAAGASK